MYSSLITEAMIKARVEELHRSGRASWSPRGPRSATSRIRRRMATLAPAAARPKVVPSA